MSRRTALVAVWVTGTALATALAYGAVVLVLAGVSGHAAERLRYGRTIAIERTSKLGPAITATTTRRPRHATTTTLARATTTTATPGSGDHGSGTSGGASGATGSDDTLPAPPGTVEAGHGDGTGGSGGGGSGSGSGDDGGPSSPTTVAASPPATATYATTGGVINVSCSGASIRLLSSSPTNGYTMNVEKSGPDEVKVRFSLSSSGDHDSELQAHCSGGRPTLDD